MWLGRTQLVRDLAEGSQTASRFAGKPMPLLTAEQERALAERIAKGDEDARNELVRANLRLVAHIARGY